MLDTNSDRHYYWQTIGIRFVGKLDTESDTYPISFMILGMLEIPEEKRMHCAENPINGFFLPISVQIGQGIGQIIVRVDGS
jgi:hypothetical protein